MTKTLNVLWNILLITITVFLISLWFNFEIGNYKYFGLIGFIILGIKWRW